MYNRFIIRMKIGRLSCMIKAMENDIFKYRRDMLLMNDLYYCGRGDVDGYIELWCNVASTRILACQRLKKRLEMRLVVVVGAEDKNF